MTPPSSAESAFDWTLPWQRVWTNLANKRIPPPPPPPCISDWLRVSDNSHVTSHDCLKHSAFERAFLDRFGCFEKFSNNIVFQWLFKVIFEEIIYSQNNEIILYWVFHIKVELIYFQLDNWNDVFVISWNKLFTIYQDLWFVIWFW